MLLLRKLHSAKPTAEKECAVVLLMEPEGRAGREPEGLPPEILPICKQIFSYQKVSLTDISTGLI